MTQPRATLILHCDPASVDSMDESIRAWAAGLAPSEVLSDGRIVLFTTRSDSVRATELEALTTLCAGLAVGFSSYSPAGDATLQSVVTDLEVADEDLLILGDLSDVPSPTLGRHLAATLGDPSIVVVRARCLPLSRSDDPDPVVDPLCVMTRGRNARELGDFSMSATGEDPRQLLERATAQGIRISAETAGAVFNRMRWDLDEERAVPPASPGDGRLSEVDGSTASVTDGHPATLMATTLGELLRTVGVDVVVPPRSGPPAGCFLTVITRTQGTRPQCLEDMLTCLAGQTVRDFEVVIARHQVAEDHRAETADVVARCPRWLQERIRIIDVDRPGRAAPLNDALDQANGRYAAVLDDDDLVFAHWVESFLELEARGQGRVLRTVALRQDVTRVLLDGRVIASEVGPPLLDWPLTFELVDHLRDNWTPCMTVAFPRGIFRDLGHRFEETLQTTEDWEYLVRAASLVGAESLPTVTSVYRWWTDEGSSRTAHSEEEWKRNHELVLRAFDERILVLPPGGAFRLRTLLEEARGEAPRLREEYDVLNQEYHRTSGVYLGLVDTYQRTLARAENAEAKVKDLRTRLGKRRRQAERSLARLKELEASLGDRGVTSGMGPTKGLRRGLRPRKRDPGQG